MSLLGAASIVIAGGILLANAHPVLALVGILFVVLYGHEVREYDKRP